MSDYEGESGDLTPGDAFERTRICCFAIQESILQDRSRIDLSGCLEEAVIQLRKEVPQELVVNMFQKLVRFLTRSHIPMCPQQTQNLRRILFTHAGELTGMTTRTDIVSLLTSHFPHTAALAQKPQYPWESGS